jgi:hypothetical protein
MPKTLGKKNTLTSYAFTMEIRNHVPANSFQNITTHHCLFQKSPISKKGINIHYHSVNQIELKIFPGEVGYMT